VSIKEIKKAYPQHQKLKKQKLKRMKIGNYQKALVCH